MDIIIIGIIVFFSSILQGMFGFAFVLIAMPLLSLFLSIKTVAPLIALFLPLITGILTCRYRVSFNYRKILPLIIGTALSIPLGILFLLEFSEKVVKATLGVVIILYSTYSLIAKRTPYRFPSWSGYIFGLIAGALGGAFNTTGPPAVFFISTQEWIKTEIIGSLNFFIFSTSVMILFFHLLSGNISWEIVLLFLKLIPVMIAGMLAGTHFFKRMSEEKYRKALFILLIIMGGMLVFW